VNHTGQGNIIVCPHSNQEKLHVRESLGGRGHVKIYVGWLGGLVLLVPIGLNFRVVSEAVKVIEGDGKEAVVLLGDSDFNTQEAQGV